MADPATEVVNNTESTPLESQIEDALSDAERRDIETFARYGYGPDGVTPLQQPVQAQPDPVDDEDDTEEEVDDTDDSDADDTTATDEEDEDVDDLSDEELERLTEALLELREDKLISNPKIRERVEREVREKLEADYEARQRDQNAAQERDILTRQGRTAVESVFNQLTNAQSLIQKASVELDKAYRGEEFDSKIIADGFKVDPQEFERNLGAFAVAAVADSRRSYDDAFSVGFKEASAIGGQITEEERDAIVNIVNTANRIEADPNQGDGRFDKAKMYLYAETFKFVTQRAFEAGKAAEAADAKAKRDARKKILDGDAVVAAAAKEAAKRKGLPPSPTAPVGTVTGGGEVSVEAYQAAKRAGNFELADEIAAKMADQQPSEMARRLQRGR